MSQLDTFFLADKIFSPLTINQVRTKMSNLEHFIIKGNPDKFDFLFTEKDLWDFVERGISSSGRNPRANFTQYRFPISIDPISFKKAIKSKNTINISYLNYGIKKLQDLCYSAENRLGFTGTSVIQCYLSPPGKGIDFFHVDGGYAITLQIQGDKKWIISRKLALEWNVKTGGYRDESKMQWFGFEWNPDHEIEHPGDSDIEEINLKPGDILAIPPGMWHKVCANDNTSLSLNLKLSHSPALETISSQIKNILLKSEKWRSPLSPHKYKNQKNDEYESNKIDEIKKFFLEMSDDILSLSRERDFILDIWMKSILGSQEPVKPKYIEKFNIDMFTRIPDGLYPKFAKIADDRSRILTPSYQSDIIGTNVHSFLKIIFSRRNFLIREILLENEAKEFGRENSISLLRKLYDVGILVNSE